MRWSYIRKSRRRQHQDVCTPGLGLYQGGFKTYIGTRSISSLAFISDIAAGLPVRSGHPSAAITRFLFLPLSYSPAFIIYPSYGFSHLQL